MLQKLNILIGKLATVHIFDWLKKVKQIYELFCLLVHEYTALPLCLCLWLRMSGLGIRVREENYLLLLILMISIQIVFELILLQIV